MSGVRPVPPDTTITFGNGSKASVKALGDVGLRIPDCPARSRSEAWVFGPTEKQRRSLAKSFAAEVFISLHKLCKSCRFGACLQGLRRDLLRGLT